MVLKGLPIWGFCKQADTIVDPTFLATRISSPYRILPWVATMGHLRLSKFALCNPSCGPLKSPHHPYISLLVGDLWVRNSCMAQAHCVEQCVLNCKEPKPESPTLNPKQPQPASFIKSYIRPQSSSFSQPPVLFLPMRGI